MMLLFQDFSLLGKVFVYFLLLEDRQTRIVLKLSSGQHRIFTFLQIDCDASFREFCPRVSCDCEQCSQSIVHNKIANINTYSLYSYCVRTISLLHATQAKFVREDIRYW